MTIRSKFSTYTAASIGILTVLVCAGTSAKPVNAETFSVDSTNGGMALNTNNKFRKIDGQPRMAVWQRNDSDQDQQFDQMPGGKPGSTLLKHIATSRDAKLKNSKAPDKCLNAHYLGNGKEINVWDCKATDLDQNFDIIPLGGGYYQIRRTDTKFCVDSPTRTDGGKVHLWECLPSNSPSISNQRWKSSQTGTPSSAIIQRAQVWIDRAIPYSQKSYYQGYRQDCSGFVSMAWQLPTSAVTGTLPGYSVTLSSKDQLQPGDAINNRRSGGNNGHVVLFVRWVDKNLGKFTAYEENGGYGKAVQTTLTLESKSNGFNVREYSPKIIPGPWYLERKK